jgi:hypothetical protein
MTLRFVLYCQYYRDIQKYGTKEKGDRRRERKKDFVGTRLSIAMPSEHWQFLFVLRFFFTWFLMLLVFWDLARMVLGMLLVLEMVSSAGALGCCVYVSSIAPRHWQTLLNLSV